jgi:AraC-like DNA-binding protein
MILLSLSIIGLILSVILLYFNARKFPITIFLGAFFFLVSLYSFIQWVFYYSRSPALVGIFYLNFAFLAYLIGPLNYWYVRSMLKDDYRLKKRDFWHIVPSLVVLVTSVPYMFTSWSFKTRVAFEIINDLNYLMIIKPTVLHQMVPNQIIYLSRDLLIFIYMIYSVLLFVRYFRQAKEKSIIFGQGYMTKWMVVFQFFFFLLVIGHILVMSRAIAYDDPDLVYAASKVQLIASIGLTGLLVSPFFFPEILYGLPCLPNQYLNERKAGNNHRNEFPKNHIAPLEADYLRLIGQKADLCMREQQPYLQKDFNLTELSFLIYIPVHHLAYFFREEKKQSFTNYRNRWRIEYSKNLIHDGKAKELTLEAIGMLSGFTNRNSFIIAFKRFEGISPHQYLTHVELTAH